MTLALAAAIGVLVGWFGRPLWFRLLTWQRMRRFHHSPTVGTPSTLASLAETYKRMYAPDAASEGLRRRRPFGEMRKNESGMDCWSCTLARGDGKDACDRHVQTAKPPDEAA